MAGSQKSDQPITGIQRIKPNKINGGDRKIQKRDLIPTPKKTGVYLQTQGKI